MIYQGKMLRRNIRLVFPTVTTALISTAHQAQVTFTSSFRKRRMVHVCNWETLSYALESIVEAECIGISSRPRLVQVCTGDRVYLFPRNENPSEFQQKVNESLEAILQSEGIAKVAYQYEPLSSVHSNLVASIAPDAILDDSWNRSMFDLSVSQRYNAAVDAFAALQAYRKKLAGVEEEYNPKKIIEMNNELLKSESIRSSEKKPQPVVRSDLPSYEGLKLEQVTVVETEEQLQLARRQLSACRVVGFDSEWFHQGKPGSAPDLVQLASPERAFLFPTQRAGRELVFQQRLVAVLKSLLENPSILKVGFDLKQDIKQISRRFNCAVRPIDDLGVSLTHLVDESERLGLTAAVAEVLGRQFSKSRSMAMSDWSMQKLTPGQLLYAANDAHAALMVYLTYQQQQQQKSKKDGSDDSGSSSSSSSSSNSFSNSQTETSTEESEERVEKGEKGVTDSTSSCGSSSGSGMTTISDVAAVVNTSDASDAPREVPSSGDASTITAATATISSSGDESEGELHPRTKLNLLLQRLHKRNDLAVFSIHSSPHPAGGFYCVLRLPELLGPDRSFQGAVCASKRQAERAAALVFFNDEQAVEAVKKWKPDSNNNSSSHSNNCSESISDAADIEDESEGKRKQPDGGTTAAAVDGGDGEDCVSDNIR